jgi:putative salt-induced outer membrane protein YdiY
MADVKSINPPPDLRWKGALTAGGSAASGNTDSRAAFGSGKLEIRSKKHRFTLNAKANYAESDDTVTARNFSGSGKYDYFFREKFFVYGQTLQEQDKLQDLDLRSTYGTGIGYQFFDSQRFSLFGETGVSLVAENYETAEDRSYSSGRWAVGMEWVIVPDRIKFFHSHEGYLSFEDSEDFYFRSEQGFNLPLIMDFFCNLQLDYDYKNKPSPGKKNADMRYFLGLGYEFSN